MTYKTAEEAPWRRPAAIESMQEDGAALASALRTFGDDREHYGFTEVEAMFMRRAAAEVEAAMHKITFQKTKS